MHCYDSHHYKASYCVKQSLAWLQLSQKSLHGIEDTRFIARSSGWEFATISTSCFGLFLNDQVENTDV